MSNPSRIDTEGPDFLDEMTADYSAVDPAFPLRVELARVSSERDKLAEALWQCYQEAGADPSWADGADHARRLGSLAQEAVEAVKELRQDYIEAGGG